MWPTACAVGWARTAELSLNPAGLGALHARLPGQTGAFEFFDFPDPAGFQNETARLSFGYQVEAQAGRRHLVDRRRGRRARDRGAGLTVRRPAVARRAPTSGVYLQDRVVLGDRVFLTAGGRVEHNDSFGTTRRAAGRPGLARADGDDAAHAPGQRGGRHQGAELLRVVRGLVLRAGQPRPGARAEPDLRPRASSSGSWAAGSALEATLFHHEYLRPDRLHGGGLRRPSRAPTSNLGRTRAPGLELVAEAVPTAPCALHAAYTLPRRRGARERQRLRPRLRGGTRRCCAGRSTRARSPRALANARCDVGATLLAVGRRADSDFAGLGLTENEGYTRLDARARVRLGRGLEAFVVAENLLRRANTRRRSAIRRWAAPCAPGCASARGPNAARDSGADPPRLEQREGQRLAPPRPRGMRGRGGGRPAHHRQRGPRPRGHARGAARAARGAGRGGRPPARWSCASPRPARTRSTRRPWGGPSPTRRTHGVGRWPSATCSSRTSAATARSRWRAPACAPLPAVGPAHGRRSRAR